MGIYIPNMSKPKSCAECFRLLKCKSVPRWVTTDDSIPKGCPLIEIADDVWENESHKLIRMTQGARFNKEMAERRANE